MNENFDITTIEETIRTAVRELGVSDKVYVNRPKAVSESVADFVVVKVTGRVNDLNAFATCSISISLFAKNVNNIKNGKKLSSMQQKLNGLSGKQGKLLLDLHPQCIGDAPDDFGFYARVILFNNTTIKII